MSESPNETPDLTPTSLHFQILLVGTVIFLVALFWLTQLPHENTHAAQTAVAVPRLVAGIQALGCYLGFVSIVLGHVILRRRPWPNSEKEN